MPCSSSTSQGAEEAVGRHGEAADALDRLGDQRRRRRRRAVVEHVLAGRATQAAMNVGVVEVARTGCAER